MTRTTGAVSIACAAFAAVLLTAGVATAQEEGEQERPKRMKDRMDLVEEQVDQLRYQVDELIGQEPPDTIRSRLDQLQDNIDALIRDIQDLRVQADEGAAAADERDSRLDAMAEEVESLWSDVDAIGEQVSGIEEREVAGYDDGFFVQSEDGRHRLVIGGYARPYYRLGLQKGWDRNPDGTLYYDPETMEASGGELETKTSEFGLASGRLVFDATVFEKVSFRAEIDYSTLHGQVEYPLNANLPTAVDYHHVEIEEHALNLYEIYGELALMDELRLRAGQYVVGFDREAMFEDRGLTFSSRSLMTRSYPRWGENMPADALTRHWDYEMQRGSSFHYDRGFQVDGSVWNEMFKYAVGLYNGGGPNVGNDNRDVMVTTRIASDFLGPMTPGMSDLDTVSDPLLSVGAAFAYDLPEHRDPVDPQRTYNSEDLNVAGDLHAKWMGASLLASVFYRRTDHGAVFENNSKIGSLGFSGQLAYFNDPTGLEPAFRYSFYDADIERELDHIHEMTGALGYHPFPGHLKLLLEWRGLFAADKQQSYMAPWGVWYEDHHELTLMAQVSF
jgi:hypothetical protein